MYTTEYSMFNRPIGKLHSEHGCVYVCMCVFGGKWIYSHSIFLSTGVSRNHHIDTFLKVENTEINHSGYI